MQKVKPKWIFLFMLLFIVIITMLKDLNFPYSKVMFQIWEIQLPNHYKQLYEKNIFSLNGDGERYHIFEYKSNNEINNLPFWQDGPNNYVQIKIAKVLNNLKVDKKYFPDFKQNYKYYFVERYDHSKLYLIYDSKKKRIYIIEEIM